jgi:membrane protease YdiL (CAAX protease family)
MQNNLGQPTRDFHAGEFTLVLFVAFASAILASLVAISNYNPNAEIAAFGDAHLWSLVGYEIVVTPVIFFILRHSGWKWPDFHVNYSNRGTAEGLVLAVIAFVVLTVTEHAVGQVNITPPSASVVAVLVVSLLNPWYEELLVCAFVIEALRKRFGLAAAVNVSIAIRLTYHLYQGPPAFIMFAIFGLLVTLFYVRTGRLWPVIVAHSLLDFTGLAGFEV